MPSNFIPTKNVHLCREARAKLCTQNVCDYVHVKLDLK